jgi:hypothetical protein
MDTLLCLWEATHFQSMELERPEAICGLESGARSRLWSTRGDCAGRQEVAFFRLRLLGIEFACLNQRQLSQNPSAGDGGQVSIQKLLSLTFELDKLHTVAELVVTGDDLSVNHSRTIAEPKSGSDPDTDCEGHHHLDVATASAQVRGFKAHRDIRVFGMNLYLDLDGVARMTTTLFGGDVRIRWPGVGRIHSSGARRLDGPELIIDMEERGISRGNGRATHKGDRPAALATGDGA